MERWDVLRLWKGEGLALTILYFTILANEIEDLLIISASSRNVCGQCADLHMIIIFIKLLSHGQR